VYRYTQASNGSSNEQTNYELFEKDGKYTISYIAPVGFESFFAELQLPTSYNSYEEIKIEKILHEKLPAYLFDVLTWTSTVDGKDVITVPTKTIVITPGETGDVIYTGYIDYTKIDYEKFENYSGFTNEKIQGITIENIAKIPATTLETWSVAQINALSPEQVNAFSADQIIKLKTIPASLTIAKLKEIPAGSTPAVFAKNILLPVLSEGLAPVVYNASLSSTDRKSSNGGTLPAYWEEATTIDEWYDYKDNSVVSNPTTSKWANVVTKDGSLFVWIPRYAYKITSNLHSSTAGIIEIKFIDKNNKVSGATKETLPISINYPEVVASEISGNKMADFVVHPAFVGTTDFSNGGWDADLAGMWVAKFEMSGSTSTLKSVPGVQSLRNTTISNMFSASKSYNTSMESHLMKNSEWGAVAYLAHSSYGRNRTEITINSSSSYYTGGTSTLTTIYGTNVKQSTTNNQYGIYDLSGGAWEDVSVVLANGNSSISTYGENLNVTTSSKYITVYTKGSSDTRSTNYSANNYASTNKKFGDAVYETSSSYESSSGAWNTDYSYFSVTSTPFFRRGGYFNNGSNGGIFAFYHSDGEVLFNIRFACRVLTALT
jgi:hypothetical protein